MNIEINNVWWWILVAFNILGFFVYKFSTMADGAMKELDKTIGITIVGITYAIMAFWFGLPSFLVLLIVVPLFATPFLVLLFNFLEDTIFPERTKLRKSLGLTRERYIEIRNQDIHDLVKSHLKEHTRLKSKN